MKIWYFLPATCLHLIMLKADTEIHFPDRTVDHPITGRKLITPNSSVWKTEATLARGQKTLDILVVKTAKIEKPIVGLLLRLSSRRSDHVECFKTHRVLRLKPPQNILLKGLKSR